MVIQLFSYILQFAAAVSSIPYNPQGLCHCPPAPAASQSADALGDPKAAGGRALKDTKKDVHSRAYHAALRKAKKAGTDPAECKKLASKAGAAAAAEWDKAHP